MTVSAGPTYAELSWTGVETSFNPGIQALSAAHMLLSYRTAGGVVSTLTAGVHLAVARDPVTRAITATPVALPAAPGTVIFERVTPAVQATSFADLAKYSATVHELLHDAAAMRSAEANHYLATLAALQALVNAADAAAPAAIAAANTAVIAQHAAEAARDQAVAIVGVTAAGVPLTAIEGVQASTVQQALADLAKRRIYHDMSAGTAIGTYVLDGGLAATIDGLTHQNNGPAAFVSDSQSWKYLGITFTDPQAVSGAEIYPSADQGFVQGTGGVTFNLRGKTGVAPSDAGQGTLLGTVSITPDQVARVDVLSSDVLSKWKHVWFETTNVQAGQGDWCSEFRPFLTGGALIRALNGTDNTVATKAPIDSPTFTTLANVPNIGTLDANNANPTRAASTAYANYAAAAPRLLHGMVPECVFTGPNADTLRIHNGQISNGQQDPTTVIRNTGRFDVKLTRLGQVDSVDTGGLLGCVDIDQSNYFGTLHHWYDKLASGAVGMYLSRSEVFSGSIAFAPVTGATIQNGGANFAVNDIVRVLLQNTNNAAANYVVSDPVRFTEAVGVVTAVSGGVVTGLTIKQGANRRLDSNNALVDKPPNPVNATAFTGIGTGLTLNLTYGALVTNAGLGLGNGVKVPSGGWGSYPTIDPAAWSVRNGLLIPFTPTPGTYLRGARYSQNGINDNAGAVDKTLCALNGVNCGTAAGSGRTIELREWFPYPNRNIKLKGFLSLSNGAGAGGNAYVQMTGNSGSYDFIGFIPAAYGTGKVRISFETAMNSISQIFIYTDNANVLVTLHPDWHYSNES